MRLNGSILVGTNRLACFSWGVGTLGISLWFSIVFCRQVLLNTTPPSGGQELALVIVSMLLVSGCFVGFYAIFIGYTNGFYIAATAEMLIYKTLTAVHQVPWRAIEGFRYHLQYHPRQWETLLLVDLRNAEDYLLNLPNNQRRDEAYQAYKKWGTPVVFHLMGLKKPAPTIAFLLKQYKNQHQL